MGTECAHCCYAASSQIILTNSMPSTTKIMPRTLLLPPRMAIPFLTAMPDTLTDPEAALELPWEFVPASEARGRIAAEYVWAYPPGIPCLIPGERIGEDFRTGLASRVWHSTRGKMPAQIAVLRENPEKF